MKTLLDKPQDVVSGTYIIYLILLGKLAYGIKIKMTIIIVKSNFVNCYG